MNSCKILQLGMMKIRLDREPPRPSTVERNLTRSCIRELLRLKGRESERIRTIWMVELKAATGLAVSMAWVRLPILLQPYKTIYRQFLINKGQIPPVRR